MTTAPTPIAPVQPAPASAQVGKQADDATSGAEFSQVLSGEIAQQKQRGSSAGHAAAKGEDKAVDAAETTPADAAEAAAAAASGLATPDAFLVDTQQARSLLPAAEAADAPAAAETPPTAVAVERAPVELTPGVQAAAAAPIAAGRAAGEKPELPQAVQGVPQGGKGRTARAVGAQQAADHAAVARMTDASQQAGKSAAAAPAPQATERQAEGGKPEFLTELMSHPAMRATAQAAAEPAVAAASNRLAPQVGTPAWGQALGEKIVWMAGSAQQTASLTLNPPNLGPVQVVIEVSNDQATASFFAAQPEVRQAIEAAFPRLKDMMSDAGIQLGQATVSADTPAQHEAAERQAQRNAPAFSAAGDAPAAGQIDVPVAMTRSGRGLVDTFA